MIAGRNWIDARASKRSIQPVAPLPQTAAS
jgi:hypothetical protein